MDDKLKRVIRSAALASLIFLCTYFLRIPVTNGYVHLGDGLILLCAMITPLSCALPAAVIGASLADLLSGFAMYIPATLIIKGAMACVMRGFAKNNTLTSRKNGKADLRGIILTVAGAILAGAVNTAGYFCAEIIMIGAAGAALDVISNVVQSACSIIVLFVLIPVAKKVKL